VQVVGQSRLLAPPGESLRLPVAHMVCNGGPPIGDKPSLMTFMEVETLFHEFGHALQHMLTTQEEGMVRDCAVCVSGVPLSVGCLSVCR
jgi:oligopeptidase A